MLVHQLINRLCPSFSAVMSNQGVLFKSFFTNTMGTGSRLSHMRRVVCHLTRGIGFDDFIKNQAEARNFRQYFTKCAQEGLQGTPRHSAAWKWLWYGISQCDVEWVLKGCTVC
jgi:hypothetical protein